MKMYLSYFNLKFKLGLQYRIAALSGILTQFFFGFVYISVYIAFYNSGSDNVPIDLDKLVSFIWLQQAFFTIAYLWYKDKEILNNIKKGNIAYELLRPQKLYFMWLSKISGERLSKAFLRFLPVLIIASLLPGMYRLNLSITLLRLILFIPAFILGTILMLTLVTLFHVICLYTIDEKGIVNILMITADILSGLVIPIPFFPKFLQNISNILPFRYVSDFPLRLYVGSIPLNECFISYIVQIIWILILGFLGYFLTKNALKKISIQGG